MRRRRAGGAPGPSGKARSVGVKEEDFHGEKNTAADDSITIQKVVRITLADGDSN